MNSRNSKNNRSFATNLGLALLTTLLLCLPWLQCTSLSLLAAFVPLFCLNRRVSNRAFILWSLAILAVWHVVTLIWVGKAAAIGVVAATVVGVTLCIIPLILFGFASRKTNKFTAYALLVCGWIAAEFLYIHGEISFPWLVLGNGFALDARIVQWYEYTGALGGTLWAFLCNILLYETLTRRSRTYGILAACFLLVPVLLSEIIYRTYRETDDPMTVTIVQPNIDPYNEKFGGMTFSEQTGIIEQLALEAPADAEFILAPETALEGNIIEGEIGANGHVARLRANVTDRYPNASLITGAVVYRIYPAQVTDAPTLTARKMGGGQYYDVINGAIQIGADPDSIPLYIKSKLVIGVEMLPYRRLLSKISLFSVDLGGESGHYLTQPEREVFTGANGEKVGTAVCFEGVYGEHYAGFVRAGAQAMFIISNDGWWEDTFGYKHLLNYSRLRAIETRRDIARSANTGISAIIDQRGDVVDSLGWDVRGSLTGPVNLNDRITFYTAFGDWVGRAASFLLVIILLYLLAVKMKRKSQLFINQPK